MIDLPHFNLYLVRHGESEVNVNPDIMGQSSEVNLTDCGMYQANKLKTEMSLLKFDKIYSSSYVRAFKTAKIVFPESAITLVDALREYDAGDWQGHLRSRTLTDKVKLKMNYLNMSFIPPNGESQNMVERRASEWLDNDILYNKNTLNAYIEKRAPLDIIAFSHGMTIKSLLHYIIGFDKSFLWKIEIDNTSVSKLSFDETGWRLHFINNTSHLFKIY